MEAARTNPYFQETYGCTRDLAVGRGFHYDRAKQFCHMYWRASAAYDAIKPVVRNATLTQSDPQTAIVATVLSIPREHAAIGLALFVALVAEIVSSLGVYTFSKSLHKPSRAERKERKQARSQGKLRLAVSNS